MTWLSFREGRHDIGRIDVETFDIKHVAHRLAHINRFNGDVGAYSVAQHCCYASCLVPDKFKLSTLLHDLHEAYMGDVTTPMKLYFPDIETLSGEYLDQIDEMFGVQTRHDAVHEADRQMLAIEAAYFGLNTEGWSLPEVNADFVKIFKPWPPEYAASMFINLFGKLTNDV